MILKLLSFIFILYLIFRLVSFFFRGLFMVMGKKAYERAYKQQSGHNGRQRKGPEGSVQIEHIPAKDKKQPADFKGGEYVDYEEIKK